VNQTRQSNGLDIGSEKKYREKKSSSKYKEEKKNKDE
jgi:hypothetical protein